LLNNSRGSIEATIEPLGPVVILKPDTGRAGIVWAEPELVSIRRTTSQNKILGCGVSSIGVIMSFFFHLEDE
jgi:hypothetical protein